MGLPDSRVDEMLDLVSLDQTEAKRRLRNYSLGMKQRLGIAHALLGDPSVLILDEPANGLDPAGIRWMRGLLKGYADRGGTVLLSSHLLNEVEQIADEMILIGRGKIVAQRHQGRAARRSTEHKTSLVTALDNELLTKALQRQGLHRLGGRHRPPGRGAAPVEVGTRRRRGRDRPHRPPLRGRRPRGAVPHPHRGHAARRPPRRRRPAPAATEGAQA